MPSLIGAGGVIETEYRHASAGERHALRLNVAHFDPTPITTAYGTNDRAYISGGPVAPVEHSVLETFSHVAALWAPYYSPNWAFAVVGLQSLVSDTETPLLPAPLAVPVPGSNTSDNDGGQREKRIIRLLGQTGAVRRFYLSQVSAAAHPASAFEVSPTSGGLDTRDRAWLDYLSGNTGGGAVMPDGTYCFAVTDMQIEWARPIEAASWVTPGAPYLVTG